jgi:hypothetical protein
MKSPQGLYGPNSSRSDGESKAREQERKKMKMCNLKEKTNKLNLLKLKGYTTKVRTTVHKS